MMTSAVNEKSAQAEQIKTLRMELLETQRNLRVTSLMMDSYGAMAIGQDYQEYKGYHDAEMWQYAEKRMENLEEIRQCDEVLMDELPSSAATSSPPSHGSAGGLCLHHRHVRLWNESGWITKSKVNKVDYQ